jgi:glucosamine--fructose-6-phosphate aminotransferase (isomerizing)
VNESNAHPHLSRSGKIAIVHNGIIENYESLKHRLQDEGYIFQSDTDSEVVAHLLEDFYEGNLEEAMSNVLGVIKGTYGIVAIHADEPNKLVGVRNGSPLVLGVGNGEMYLGSDVAAMVAYTKQVIYLEDGEMVVVTPEQFETFDLRNQPVDKKISVINWELEEMEKGDFPHFMLKEIFEQPESIARAFQGRLDPEQATAKLGGLNMSSREILQVERVKIIAAGTSFHAGMVGAHLLETLARIPASAELASEVRYRNPIVEKDALYFAVSQSGETADTLYAMRELQRKGATVLGIVNVVGSTIARESNGGVYIHSGPEIAVASTKAFTSQITVFFLLTLLLGRMKNMSFPKGQKFIHGMESVGPALKKILAQKEAIHQLAKKYAHYKDFLFLGRGLNYPVALEGALKLKEISYIHAEGYSAAEIKHGPIALINDETPSVFLVPKDFLREKVISNMKEIKARKGLVIAICEEGDLEVNTIADDTIEVPSIGDLFTPYTMIIPLQLFSYYCALELGRDVDQPRNLAKSVTVE